MTGRRWITWLIFGLCALLVVDVLGWATWRVLALERAERRASVQADAAQRERLALWQMDSLVSALIARESARPYFEYRARYAADLPYDRAWDIDNARVVARSPLDESRDDPIIRLHYQVEPDGSITSPLVDPDDPSRPDTLRAGRLIRELSMYEGLTAGDALSLTTRLGMKRENLEEPAIPPGGMEPPESVRIEPASPETPPKDRAQAETDRADADLRRQLFDLARGRRPALEAPAPASAIEVGVFQPRWLFDPVNETQLVFERPVVVAGQTHRQGIWIDWPTLRAELLAVALRIFDDARLEPVGRPGPPSGRTLATIPLRLEYASPSPDSPAWTPTRATLAVTWVAALASLTAIGLVLSAAIRLADRRGRFVAAVAHELRSPLTSFRLSTDLLARTDDPEKRRERIESLRLESKRLGTVVENVLAYAGLRKAEGETEARPLGPILDATIPSLERRAAEAGATLVVRTDEPARAASIRVGPGSLERILDNLVDNACRYGLEGESPVVRLVAERAGRQVRIRIEDSGPGIPPPERDRIFGDFYRGTNSRRSHSGVGLGLALARGLARAEGGELRLVRVDQPGASFELTLPAESEGDG